MVNKEKPVKALQDICFILSDVINEPLNNFFVFIFFCRVKGQSHATCIWLLQTWHGFWVPSSWRQTFHTMLLECPRQMLSCLQRKGTESWSERYIWYFFKGKVYFLWRVNSYRKVTVISCHEKMDFKLLVKSSGKHRCPGNMSCLSSVVLVSNRALFRHARREY